MRIKRNERDRSRYASKDRMFRYNERQRKEVHRKPSRARVRKIKEEALKRYLVDIGVNDDTDVLPSSYNDDNYCDEYDVPLCIILWLIN